MDNRILFVGSIAYDSIVTNQGEYNDILGGSGSYFATAASIFAEPAMVGVVGEDFKEEDILFFKKRGVDTIGLQVEKGKTFRWKGRYSKDFNNRETVYTHLNVFEKFNPILPESYKTIERVFLANISPKLQIKVLNQLEKPKIVVADTMNFWINREKKELLELLKRVNVFVLNDEEATLLTDEQDMVKACVKLHSFGPEMIVLKKGVHGVMAHVQKQFILIPAYPVLNVKDTTGAGDSFAGGMMPFLDDLTNIDRMKFSLLAGTVISSFTVEGVGISRLKEITVEDFKERLNDFKNMIKPPSEDFV